MFFKILLRTVSLIARFHGRRVLLLTPGQARRWRVIEALFCEARYGEPGAPPKGFFHRVHALGPQTRAAVERRSGGLCEMRMNERCTREAFDVHHIIYKSIGGTNELENLKHTCLSCHRSVHAKKDPPVSDDIAQKIRWGKP